MDNKLPEILKRKRAEKNLSQDAVAEAIGKSLRQYIYYETGESVPRHDTIVKLATLLEFEPKELYESATELHTLNEPAVPFLEKRRKSKQSHNLYEVPFVPIKAQAGYVKAVDQETYLNTLEKYALPPGVNPQGAVWRYWEIEGDSMEPSYHSGDYILTSQVHQFDWENLRNFYAYVIVTDDRVLFKRLYCKNALEWVLISDNEKEFPQQLLPVELIKEVWVMRRHIVNKVPIPQKFEIKV
jgi:phage repressor protein C with HTH and peptisase S24 domain